MLARPERFFADRFGLTPRPMERLLGSHPGRARRRRRPLPRVPRSARSWCSRKASVKKASRHVSQGAGRPRPVRRAHRLRPHRRHLAAQSRGSRAPGARHRRPARRPRRWWRCAVAAARTISTRWPSRPSSPRWTASSSCSARSTRRPAPPTRASSQVIASLGSEEVVVLIATAVGLDGRRRPPAHAAQRHGDRRGERQARDRHATAAAGAWPFDFFLEEERWTRFAREAARQAILKLHAVEAPAGEHDRGARARLAGHPAPRGDRPRARGRLQPQGDLGVRRPHRPEGRLRAGHGGRRRHHRRTAAARSTWTTRATPTGRNVLIENGVLRRLPAGPAQRAPHGR